MESPMEKKFSNVQVESVLRIRPLLKKENEDIVVLEPQKLALRNEPATAVLHGLGANQSPTDYHFNHVLPEKTSQDKLYYTIGLPIATSAMNSLKVAARNGAPKSHLLICMGVVSAGKTYTCFGGDSIPKRRASQDGLVPRLIDSLFSQSKHHSKAGSKGFAVNVSVVQVSNSKKSDPNACQIQDLLASPRKSKSNAVATRRSVGVLSLAAKFEKALSSPIRSPLKSAEFVELNPEEDDPSFTSCRDVAQAREVLNNALNACKKGTRGQNHHLFITLQPVVDGNQFGDKIAILDMAGLEKGKRNQSRARHSVANRNEAASAAVLHCLRTLMHNTNVRNHKSDPLDKFCADDMVSEISCVSQEKDPLQRQFKSVPFQQHKVTMLLRSLFALSTPTRVTVLVSAYPGHIDYAEKKSLLQDIELLCGAALLSCRATAATGLERGESQSSLTVASTTSTNEVRDQDEAVKNYFSSHRDQAKEMAASSKFSSSRDEDANSRRHQPGRGNPANLWASKISSKSHGTKSKPIRRSRSSSDRWRSNNSLTLSESLDEDEDALRHPPAYAPQFSKSNPASNTKVCPIDQLSKMNTEIDPPLHEIKNKVKPPTNPSFVSDFPGIAFTPKAKLSSPISERRNATAVVPSGMVGGPKARAPPSQEDSAALTKKHDLSNSKSKNILCLSKQPDYHDNRTDKGVSPRRSSFENGYLMFENGRSSFDNSEKYSKKETPRSTMTNSRIKELEAKMTEIIRQKRALEQKCSELEKENQYLKRSLRRAGNEPDWTNKDEEEYLKSREIRLEAQTLIKAPLMNHLEKVNRTYDIKNQWCKSDKSPFSLKFPSYFERASTLNLRDKEKENIEENKIEGESLSENFAIPAVKLTYDSKDHAQKSRVKQSSNFSALKRLAQTQ